jgi:hypothetical protein
MSTLRTNAILDASGGNTATINTVPLRPGVLDPENRIINGAFDFWQRGTSGSGFGFVGPDRWINVTNAGTVTMSRQAFTLGDTLGSNNPTYFVRQVVSGQTTAGSVVTVAQRIEGVRSYAGQTITILGWVRRSSGSGNMAVSVDQVFGTGGSPSVSVSLAGQTVTLTGSWAPFAAVLAIPSITGKTLGSNNNDYLQLNFFTSAGSDFNSQSNSLGLQTIGVDLWGVHIKVGTHTTAATDLYKQPELGPESARCQRYYATGTARFDGAASNGVTYSTPVKFPQTMRGTPTIAETNVSNVAFPASSAALSLNSSSYSSARTANATASSLYVATYTADAEL